MINFVSSEKEKKFGDIVAVKTETQTTTWKYTLNHKIEGAREIMFITHYLNSFF